MRLIDADEVIKTIKEVKDPNVAADVLEHIISTTPTAFDLEAVIKELNEEQEVWLRGYNQTLQMGMEHLWRNMGGRAFGVTRAIDIMEEEIARRSGETE